MHGAELRNHRKKHHQHREGVIHGGDDGVARDEADDLLRGADDTFHSNAIFFPWPFRFNEYLGKMVSRKRIAQMKVLIINGSPRPNGCTARGLKEVEKVLNDGGIATKFVNIAGAVIPGCVACGYCEKHGECFRKDIVNELVRELKDADGLLVGTPVYYAGSNGSLLSLLDRMFYSKDFPCTMKVGAAIASSRRAGSNTALDEIEKYFSIAGMPIVTSTYWNKSTVSAPRMWKRTLRACKR